MNCCLLRLKGDYRKALKETKKAFTEYRLRALLNEEPVYEDGLVLSKEPGKGQHEEGLEGLLADETEKVQHETNRLFTEEPANVEEVKEVEDGAGMGIALKKGSGGSSMGEVRIQDDKSADHFFELLHF
nr:neurofilament medium polypeptide-like [Ipomoea batatas]